MKTITQIKIARLNRRLNDWILDILCYPVNLIEKTIKRANNRNKDVYMWSKPMRYY